jgi:hypothetical protein
MASVDAQKVEEYKARGNVLFQEVREDDLFVFRQLNINH